MTTNVLCRVCGQPLAGEGALDPDAPPGSVSYLHPACAATARRSAAERRHAEQRRLDNAAVYLLEACDRIAEALPPEHSAYLEVTGTVTVELDAATVACLLDALKRARTA